MACYSNLFKTFTQFLNFIDLAKSAAEFYCHQNFSISVQYCDRLYKEEPRQEILTQIIYLLLNSDINWSRSRLNPIFTRSFTSFSVNLSFGSIVVAAFVSGFEDELVMWISKFGGAAPIVAFVVAFCWCVWQTTTTQLMKFRHEWWKKKFIFKITIFMAHMILRKISGPIWLFWRIVHWYIIRFNLLRSVF